MISLAFALVLGFSAGALHAHPKLSRAASGHDKKVNKNKEVPRALSVGSPTEGRLENPDKLASSKLLRVRAPRGGHYGMPELVRMLERSASRVAKKLPGARLVIGDLSLPQGGDIAGHHSHESGRDADVGFYYVDGNGKPVPVERFQQVDWDGKALHAKGLRFDDARNWALVEAWLTDPQARIQHIFIAKPLRARLLKFARKKGTYLPVLHRAAIAMKQPSRGLAHDDHFHVRIACPRGQGDVCVPEPERARKKQPSKLAKGEQTKKRRNKRHKKPSSREAQAKEQRPRKRSGL